MGNWHISIRGTGCHHNRQSPTDANRMAADFVQKLRDAGHHVEAAVFTHGGEDVIAQADGYLSTPVPGKTPDQYLTERDAIEK